MTSSTVQIRMNELYDLLEKAIVAYYDPKLENILNDLEYDSLLEELRKFEKMFPAYVKENSMINNIGIIEDKTVVHSTFLINYLFLKGT